MKRENCLDFCEILSYLLKKKLDLKKIYETAKKQAGYDTCERIYFGSSFCGKYFLHQRKQVIEELKELCQKEGMHLTMTVPVFSQSDLAAGKEKIKELCEICQDVMDEITVNDYAMVVYLAGQCRQNLNLGRIFTKDYRDPRYKEYFSQTWFPKIFTAYLKNFLYKYKIAGIEFDPTHELIDLSQLPEKITAGVHEPYCYMTMGRICQYASFSYASIEKKFRANMPCGEECQDTVIVYDAEEEKQKFIRIGRAVFFYNPDIQIKGVSNYRTIYLPMDMEVKA